MCFWMRCRSRRGIPDLKKLWSIGSFGLWEALVYGKLIGYVLISICRLMAVK